MTLNRMYIPSTYLVDAIMGMWYMAPTVKDGAEQHTHQPVKREERPGFDNLGVPDGRDLAFCLVFVLGCTRALRVLTEGLVWGRVGF